MSSPGYETTVCEPKSTVTLQIPDADGTITPVTVIRKYLAPHFTFGPHSLSPHTTPPPLLSWPDTGECDCKPKEPMCERVPYFIAKFDDKTGTVGWAFIALQRHCKT